jgi:hypothetical protein
MLKLWSGQIRTDASLDGHTRARTNEHTPIAKCENYVELTASGLDKVIVFLKGN